MKRKKKKRKTYFSPRDVAVANISWAVVFVVCVSLLRRHHRLPVFHVIVVVSSLSKYLKNTLVIKIKRKKKLYPKRHCQ
jgi:hypothetical protein